ncbi:uncharacterized protein LOC118464928 [Anopheles albimanus]|uniref:uncharacterized protein LOC118464928 n=1 Tax=Anopheles albimanus TaxID=7167 RepID=UPI00163E809A|nr:uncharacterized protein LOC118464928 [Anopheles albimanus]
MGRSCQWVAANAAVIAIMQNIIGLPSITINHDQLCCFQGRSNNWKWKCLSNASVFRGLLTVVFLLISPLNGFFSMDRNNGSSKNTSFVEIKNSRNVTRNDFDLELIISYSLMLVTSVCIYIHRWINIKAVIGLNYDFKLLYQNIDLQGYVASRLDRCGHLVGKQSFGVMSLCVLWMNLYQLNDMASIDAYFYVRKFVESIGMWLPALICLLVSLEMSINFYYITIKLSALNRSLNLIFRYYRHKLRNQHKYFEHSQNYQLEKSKLCGTETNAYLSNAIQQLHKLVDTTVVLVQFYSPILLLILGMHFVRFIMQVVF